jgi:hypothetical protein
MGASRLGAHSDSLLRRDLGRIAACAASRFELHRNPRCVATTLEFFAVHGDRDASREVVAWRWGRGGVTV